MAEMQKWKYNGTGQEGGVDFTHTQEGLGTTSFGVRYLKRPEYENKVEIWVKVTPKDRKKPVQGLVYLDREQVEELYKAMCR